MRIVAIIAGILLIFLAAQDGFETIILTTVALLFEGGELNQSRKLSFSEGVKLKQASDYMR